MRGWILGLAPRRRLLMLGLVLVVALLAGGVAAVNAQAAPPPAPGSTQPLHYRLNGHQLRFYTPFTGSPVVLVPGYNDDLASFEDLSSRLEFSGRRAYVMNLPGDGMGDLNVQAEALQKLVERIRQRPVDVIGYSAGGVVVRLWIAKYGGATEARHVVTLGSPLHGANVAGVGAAFAPDACPVACQQLAPGSVLLATMNAMPLPAGVSWMSIWSDNDKTVDPPDSARLNGAVNVELQSICPHRVISHSDLPGALLVEGLVLDALGPGPIAAPTPAECIPLQRPFGP